MPRIVDIHNHYYPKAYLDVLERVVRNEKSAWAEGARSMKDNQFQSHAGMTDIQKHIDDMDEAGVETEVISLSVPMSYFAEEKDAVEGAKVFNDSLAEICARYPKRFKAFASLPLPHTDASLKELDRAINTLGLHGVGFGANAKHANAHLDDPRIMPVYPEINRMKLTIFLHPALPPGIEESMDYGLWVAAEFLWDSTLATLKLANAGVFAQNPDMNFIVPHLGNFLLAGIDRVAGQGQRYPSPGAKPAKMEKTVKEYCLGLYYDSIINNPAFWDLAVATVGLDHIVYGTDYPFVDGVAGVKRNIARINSYDITDAQKEAIFGGTVDKLLR